MCFSKHIKFRKVNCSHILRFNDLHYVFFLCLTKVVAQSYEVEADNEYVIRGNAAVMKCEVPSFVSDFVDVENWRDSQGNTFLPGDDYGIIELRRLFTTL